MHIVHKYIHIIHIHRIHTYMPKSAKVVVVGIKTFSGLNAGDLHFLSPTTAGAITTTAPSSAGQAVVRVGESVTATEFAIQPEPPILLR